MARDTIERTRAEDLKIIRKKAQDREDEMRMKMEEADDRNSKYWHICVFVHMNLLRKETVKNCMSK